jgi:hypothetical protein
MRLEIIQGLQIIIISLLSYVPTVTIAGWFEAWVAKKCDDDVAEQFGFLTINPLAHFNVLGFGALLIGRLLGDYLPFFQGIPGWGRYIPLNPSEYSRWRASIEFHARGFAHFVLAIAAMIFLIQCMKLGLIAADFSITTKASPAWASIIQVLQFFYSQNVLLAIIYLAIGTFRSIVFYWYPDFYMFSAEHMFLGILVLFGVVMIAAEIFRFIIASIMALTIYLMIA